jgi:hypothetical protein
MFITPDADTSGFNLGVIHIHCYNWELFCAEETITASAVEKATNDIKGNP